jgi:two-component system nitrogen regulation response regulator NtrX
MRVIAASNKNLGEEIKKGTFRGDLYYRLNVLPLEVPPLRDRSDDIPLLVRHFLLEFSQEYGQKPKTIDDDALALLVRYQWPGNVRELRNIIERLIIMVPGPHLRTGDIRLPAGNFSIDEKSIPNACITENQRNFAKLKDARAEFERQFLTRKLRENNGNVSKTADAIGVERSNLHRKIKAYGIDLGDP